jgi:hypothetical protein
MHAQLDSTVVLALFNKLLVVQEITKMRELNQPANLVHQPISVSTAQLLVLQLKQLVLRDPSATLAL